MATDRLEMLRTLVEQNPGDSRTRYMLAMELSQSGELDSAAKEYEAIVAHDADYVAAYYHGGQVLEKLGRLDDARTTYRLGIQACNRIGNEKTKAELEGVLDALRFA